LLPVLPTACPPRPPNRPSSPSRPHPRADRVTRPTTAAPRLGPGTVRHEPFLLSTSARATGTDSSRLPWRLAQALYVPMAHRAAKGTERGIRDLVTQWSVRVSASRHSLARPGRPVSAWVFAGTPWGHGGYTGPDTLTLSLSRGERGGCSVGEGCCGGGWCVDGGYSSDNRRLKSSGFTGFTRCRSKPASRARLWSSIPP
jgi:hypothetical protein